MPVLIATKDVIYSEPGKRPANQFRVSEVTASAIDMLVKPPWICGGGHMAGSGRSFKLRLLRGCRPSARRAATCGSRAGRPRPHATL